MNLRAFQHSAINRYLLEVAVEFALISVGGFSVYVVTEYFNPLRYQSLLEVLYNGGLVASGLWLAQFVVRLIFHTPWMLLMRRNLACRKNFHLLRFTFHMVVLYLFCLLFFLYIWVSSNFSDSPMKEIFRILLDWKGFLFFLYFLVSTICAPLILYYFTNDTYDTRVRERYFKQNKTQV